MRVLHMVPDSVAMPRHHFLGSTKDIRGRTEYFQTRAIAFDELPIKQRSDQWLVTTLPDVPLETYTLILIEHPLYPKTLSYLRQRVPHTPVLTRAHNAELYHHWDILRANGLRNDGQSRRAMLAANWKILKEGWRRFRLDRQFARDSDFLLSITEWETRYYWKRLTRARRVISLPYFLPAAYQAPIVPPRNKNLWCVCLMSTVPTPFTRDGARNFERAVQSLGTKAPEWSFFLTGDKSLLDLEPSPRIQQTGFLDSPLGILNQSRALAILSRYGYGFKTKILDAIQNQCYVLMPPELYARQPKALQPYCIRVDLDNPHSFPAALELCLRPFPTGAPNQELKQTAYHALDQVLACRA